MNTKPYITFTDKNNIEQIFYLSQKEKLKVEKKELKRLLKLKNNFRYLSYKKQQIKKLEDINHQYCNLFIINIFKLQYEQVLINECLPFIEILAQKKSIATVRRYIRCFRNFLFYLQKVKQKIFAISEVSKEFIIKFHGDILSGNGFDDTLSYPQRTHVYSLIVNLLNLYFRTNKEKSFKVLSVPVQKSNPRKAYSMNFLKILFTTCIFDMNKTMANYQKYKKIKEKYKGQEFYSFNNLCFTFLKYKQIKQNGQRLTYLNKVNKLKYNIDLNTYSNDKLLKNSVNGIDVTLFEQEDHIIWFLESEIPDFPYIHTKIGSYKNYFPKGESVSAFFYKYGTEVHEKFKKVMSYKLPLSFNIYPFYLYTLLVTGLNVDTLFNWKTKDEYDIGEEIHPLDSNFRIIWGLKKKTNTYIMTTVNTKEKNGLWKYIKFLKNFLKTQHSLTDNFWCFLSSKDYNVSSFSTYSLKSMSLEFCKKYNNEFSEFNIKYIEHLRLRPTKVAYELIKGKTLQSIKHGILQHKDIDTSSFYTNSDEYKDIINYKINEVQEKLIEEVINFKGDFHGSKQNLKPAYLNYCRNDTATDCFDYDNCLLCKQSRVFPEHIPIIVKTLNFYHDEILRIGIDKWILLYEELFHAAIDCLERFLNNNPIAENSEKETAYKVLEKVRYVYKNNARSNYESA